MINYNAALPAENYPASKSSINVTDWIQGIKGNLSYLIRQAFRGGEVGFAYDPNDMSTMFQDAAGTVPVTGAGQPVGLMLDKSKGLALGNELVTNGDFGTSTTGWSANNATIEVQSGQLKVTATITGDSRAQQIITGLTTGRFYTVTGNFQPISACRVRVNSVVANTAYSSGNSYQNFTLVFLATSSSATVALELASSTAWMPQGSFAYFDNISVKELAGNHAYQTVSASRPVLRKNDITGAYYLEFDGVDDFLQTNNIDFTATDEVSLFAGVRKLSDANTAVVAELSTTSDSGKAFTLFAPALLGSAKFLFRSVGSIADLSGGAFTKDTKYSAPFTAVAVGMAKISMDYMSLKLSGAVVGDAITDQGTGNYGNYPLYIGRRAGSSNPFNGHIYSLIGIGRLTTDSETIALEKSIAKNTGVALSV